jgi:hypothetical protein
MNVCLRDEAALILGVENHVCEVQVAAVCARTRASF